MEVDISIGVEYLRNKNYINAENVFNKLLQKNPSDDGAYRFLAMIYDLKKQKIAADYAEKAISIEPKQPMWLWRILVKNKLTFSMLESTKKNNLNVLAFNKLLDLRTNKIDFIETIDIKKGRGVIGKKLIYNAIIRGAFQFICPYDGKIVETNKSINGQSFYFIDKRGDYIVSFFSNWSKPYYYYQIFFINNNIVVFDEISNSEEKRTEESYKNFLQYYAILLSEMEIKKNELDNYLANTNLSKVLLKNIGYPHLGHAIWNGLSVWDEIIDKQLYKYADYINVDSGYLDSELVHFLELSQVPSYSSHNEYKENIFTITLKDDYINSAFAHMISKRSVKKFNKSNNLKELERFMKSFFPIILFSIRVGSREWIEQKEGIQKIVNYIEDRFKNVGFVFDGMNLEENKEKNATHKFIDINKEFEVVSQMQDKKNNIISVGDPIYKSIVYCEVSDFFVAPWGAGLAKYKWICNKKGIIFSSKCVLNEKTDLHIYDSDEYRENAVDDIFIDANECKNLLYKDFKSFRESTNNIGYFYQNFHCNWKSIAVEIDKEISAIMDNKSFLIDMKLKYLRSCHG